MKHEKRNTNHGKLVDLLHNEVRDHVPGMDINRAYCHDLLPVAPAQLSQ